jgi:type I restriction enzyme S subunit
MSSWSKFRLGQIASVFDGPHATPTKTGNGPWYLNIASLRSGRLRLEESAHLSEADYCKWVRRIEPRAGDVLFSYETRLGEAALMPPGLRGCLGRRMGILRPDTSVMDPRFLLYAYLGPDFQETIRQETIHGATVDRIPISTLPNWEIEIPPLNEQQAIADVLSALDDKIEANREVAGLALRTAEATYLHRSLGSSREVQLQDAGTWLSGGTPSTANESYWNGDIPWISSSSLKSFFVAASDRMVTRLGVQSGTRMVPQGTVLFVVRGMSLKTEFRVGLTQCEVTFGQDTKAIIPGPAIGSATLGVALSSFSEEVLTLVDEAGHGTGRLPTDRIERLVLPLPEIREAPAVEDALSALVRRGALAEAESRHLANMRDLLLPKLLTGEIEVRDSVSMAGAMS